MRRNSRIDPTKAVQHRRLGELNKLIRDSWRTSEDLAERTREIGNQAVAERILCGRYLNEIKDLVEHGDWYKWLAEHRPEINPLAAQRAMRMANASRVMDLSHAKNITEAYRICGILPATSPAPGSDEKSEPLYLVAMNTFTRFKTVFEKAPVTTWPESEREKLRAEIEPLVRALWPDAPLPSPR